MAYAVRADLENAIGKQAVDQIFDDDNDGGGDEDPIEQLLSEATSYVNSFLGQLYALPVRDSAGNTPPLVRFLTIDVAAGLAYERHSEYVRATGKDRLARALDMLTRLRRGEIELDSELLPAPRNETAIARSGDPAAPDVPPKVFADGMGDW